VSISLGIFLDRCRFVQGISITKKGGGKMIENLVVESVGLFCSHKAKNPQRITIWLTLQRRGSTTVEKSHGADIFKIPSGIRNDIKRVLAVIISL
jgi:hypothetical protein